MTMFVLQWGNVDLDSLMGDQQELLGRVLGLVNSVFGDIEAVDMGGYQGDTGDQGVRRGYQGDRHQLALPSAVLSRVQQPQP